MNKKIRLFEMFAGYGGASFALKKAEIDFECVGYSEIDKYAIRCYEQNHKGKNFGDCTKINPKDIPDFDLLTGGFPCQSFSVAGKGLGELDTRGTLFNEIIRIAEVKKPKYMLLENVKGLTTKKHKTTFEKILSELSRIGYIVNWKILNSKEHGIPQNRERIFIVAFIDKNIAEKFKFPSKKQLTKKIHDFLESEVDEKYYYNGKALYANLKNEVLDKDAVYQWRRKYVRKNKSGVVPTLTANMGTGGHNVPIIKDDKGIRKLTPKECFRLQGFLNDEINLNGLSNTQKYNLTGNGWDINLVSKIFEMMFK